MTWNRLTENPDIYSPREVVIEANQEGDPVKMTEDT